MRLRLFSMAWLVPGVLVAVGCLSTISTVAPEPSVAVRAERGYTGSVAIDLSDIPEAEVCSRPPDSSALCVSRFRRAYASGIGDVLEAFVTPGHGARYTATFRLLDLYHFPDSLTSPGQRTHYHLEMRWQFILKDNRGNTLVSVNRTTRGPRPLRDSATAEPVVGALVDATLRDVVAAMNSEPGIPSVRAANR
jgi:hypothetical protein